MVWPRLCLLLCIVALAMGGEGGNFVPIAINTLVLLDEMTVQTTHSQFFAQLTARGHILTFSKADNASLSLTIFGEYVYENLIIFSPKADEFGGLVDSSEVCPAPEPIASSSRILLPQTL